MLDFLKKSGYNHNFSLVSLCRKIKGESLLHSIYPVNHGRKIFDFSLYGKEIIHKKIEPMIAIFFREHKIRSFSSWADINRSVYIDLIN